MTRPKKPTTDKPVKQIKISPKAEVIKTTIAVKALIEPEHYTREYWTGDSRDGILVNGDGYHFYRMTKSGRILEAYEFYEAEDGREFACPLPEMLNVHWLEDLGFEDFEALDSIKEYDFIRIKEISFGRAGAD